MTKDEKLKKIREFIRDPQFAIFEQLMAISDGVIPYLPTLKETKIVSGKKGDQGERGDKGQIGPVGPQGKDGKDGKDGIPGRDGKDGKVGRDGKDGKDASQFIPAQIIKLLNTLEGVLDYKILKNTPMVKESKKIQPSDIDGLDKYMLNYRKTLDQRWHGSGSTIADPADLSSQLDGVTRSFTVPGAMSGSKLIGVFSSSTPFAFRPIIDYTFSSPTLTFTAGIDPAVMLAAGQTLIVQYTK